MQLRASVKVDNPDHPRHDQAGVVENIDNPESPSVVLVRFDLDKEAAEVDVSDLVQLGLN